MDFFIFMLRALFCMCFLDALYGILGRLFFAIGFKRLGHFMVAESIAGDFGIFKKTRKWLVDNCPHHNCDKCILWTCGNYSNSKGDFD